MEVKNGNILNHGSSCTLVIVLCLFVVYVYLVLPIRIHTFQFNYSNWQCYFVKLIDAIVLLFTLYSPSCFADPNSPQQALQVELVPTNLTEIVDPG